MDEQFPASHRTENDRRICLGVSGLHKIKQSSRPGAGKFEGWEGAESPSTGLCGAREYPQQTCTSPTEGHNLPT